jgi:hypothetical protein
MFNVKKMSRYEIKNADFYEFMKNNPDYFDTSDYPKDHP